MGDEITSRVRRLESGEPPTELPSNSEIRNAFGGRDIVLKVRYYTSTVNGDAPVESDNDAYDLAIAWDELEPMPNGNRVAVLFPKEDTHK